MTDKIYVNKIQKSITELENFNNINQVLARKKSIYFQNIHLSLKIELLEFNGVWILC